MLQIKDIKRYYSTSDVVTKALDGINISFRDNEFVSILGPSGSGKTTLLNVIGGLDHYTDGDLLINGVSTKEYTSRDWDGYRNNEVGFIFQGYNLIPHQTILANVELALTLSGINSTERKNRALATLEDVGLKDQANKYPKQLSGGQQQRVSIARALVNNPSIIFADEPTGALDTKTSVDIMELLKEVAKDKLVVMVTHNPELAKKYSTRIVNLQDGKIIDDTNPFDIEKQVSSSEMSEKIEKEKSISKKKTSMSLITALSLSFSNLMGKKGRTFLTSFAGSIGIFGIALILALSNGITQSINSSNNESKNGFSLSISSTRNPDDVASKTNPHDPTENNDLAVNATNSKKLSVSGANDLESLIAYFQTNPDDFADKVSTYECDYNADLIIYDSDASKTKRLYPDNFISKLNQDISSSSTTSTLGGSSFESLLAGSGVSLSSKYFYQLTGNKLTYAEGSTVLAGHWPENSHECVVTVPDTGNIDDTLMYLLGLRDSDELQNAIKAYNNHEKVNLPSSYDPIPFDKLLNMTFKVVNPSSLYTKKSNGNWAAISLESEALKAKINEGIDLKIVGIVKSNSLSQGIYYPHELKIESINKAAESEIVKDQLSKPEIDVLSGKSFEEMKKNANSAVNVNSNKTSNNSSSSSVNLNDTLSGLMTNSSISFSYEDMKTIIARSMNEYTAEKIVSTMLADKNYDEAMIKAISNAVLAEAGKSQDPEAFFRGEGHKYVEDAIKTTGKAISPTLIEQYRSLLTNVCNEIFVNMSAAVTEKIASMSVQQYASIPTGESLSNLINFNMTDDNLEKISSGLTGGRTYERNLSDFGYSNIKNPKSVIIYMNTKADKDAVKEIINNYNTQKESAGQNDKVITYKDATEEFNKSMTSIFDMISKALVAFVAISLIVSTFMIGIITYISVLERQNEIGILRAIGARKRDIFNVFNAETFIIGLVAGVMGILISLILTFPINLICKVLMKSDQDLAVMPVAGAIILIIISVVLTFIAGIFPSRKASKKDPVEAINA